MDTRNKIKVWEKMAPALERGGWSIVAGEFDPLTASVAVRIASLSAPGFRLLVVIERGVDPLFDAASRAVLLAGLRNVDAVTIEPPAEWRAVAANAGVRVHQDAEPGTGRREFEQQVAARQRMAV
ncbi:MAG TPA: hypothetical protein VN633_08775 [Bryobacteraceae bacterium]|nr:hypothetical protein [Bryobacteraceae bacterium]